MLAMRTDGSKQFFPGFHVAGYWDGDLILSKGEQGVGMYARADHREPLSGVERVELCARDTEEDEASPGAHVWIGSDA